ncbi:MAG TPA: hypothetical protein VJ772_09775 [Nitrososphaeraceae archaeon]|nr:hypothetical protein [Nitrososphaeraceae archaeon]
MVEEEEIDDNDVEIVKLKNEVYRFKQNSNSSDETIRILDSRFTKTTLFLASDRVFWQELSAKN